MIILPDDTKYYLFGLTIYDECFSENSFGTPYWNILLWQPQALSLLATPAYRCPGPLSAGTQIDLLSEAGAHTPGRHKDPHHWFMDPDPVFTGLWTKKKVAERKYIKNPQT